MNERERQEIKDAKDKWLMKENIGDAAACDFLLIKDRGLDIVYDAENGLVKEYRELLRKLLETDNDRLALMISTEAERCLIDEKEELYIDLCDEIYEHFQKGGKEYPIQAAWFHLHIINALFYLDYLDYSEKADRYMRILQDTQRTIFGDESFLFCRNWCWIVSEALCKYFPDKAMIEFARNMDLFSKILKEEDMLYQLCMNIGVIKMKWEQNTDYLKQAVELCEMWCRDIPAKLRKPKQAFIRRMSAINYRNVGELDTAIKIYREEMYLTESVKYKLYLFNQIVSMLFTKHDLSAFPELLEEGKRLIASIQEPDEEVAGFYNICGLYYQKEGQYDKALVQFDKAITLGGQVIGQDADDTIRFKYCKLAMEYDMGKMDEARGQIKQLYQIVSDNMEYYVQSFPLILNGMVMMDLDLESSINSKTIKKMKNVLKSNQKKYDLPVSIFFESNLYYLMMTAEDIYDRDDWEPLQKKLEKFFSSYPYADGVLQYLKGEYYRCLKATDDFSANEEVGMILDKIAAYCSNSFHVTASMNHFHYYYIELRNLLYKKDYIMAAGRLLSMWESVIMPLFEVLCHMKEDREESVLTIADFYAGLFVSTARQYPQLRITAKELYEFVLNLKYFEDLFYCRRQEFYSAVEQGRWLSAKDINICREELVIECYDYARNDMRDIGTLFRISGQDSLSLIHRIYFGIQLSSGIFPKRVVEVIGDAPFMEMHKKIADGCDREEVSEIEQIICDKLDKPLHKKKKIFYCRGYWSILFPLALIRVNNMQRLGDFYQIIYCNTAMDIKNDVSVQDISKSLFFGLSGFDGNKENREIQRRLDDLQYVELKVEMLRKLTGGDAYLNEKKPKEWFDGQKAEIIHFFTHTLKDERNDAISLIIEKDDAGAYKVLRDEDISKMNWNGVKLVVFSACETDGEGWEESGKHSLRIAAKKAGASFSISTWTEVSDGADSFFVVCFYKNLLRFGKICEAFFETQKMMRSMTKKEILADDDYINIDMEYYLQEVEEDFKPFAYSGDWAIYLLQMN